MFSIFMMQDKRTRNAFAAGMVGLIINLFLGSFKVIMGWSSGFLSVMGDGFNNITDVGSVTLLMMTFYFASKPSDEEHPFGHGRLEYINSTFMSAVILYVGISLLVESIEKIFYPTDTEFTPLIVGALVLGLTGKAFLYWWYKRAGKIVGSKVFDAYSADSLSDILSTTGVLAATLIEHFFKVHIDGIMGAVMSLFILWTGYGILKNSINSILGATPDAEIYQKIRECILACPGVYGVHDLIVHDYGPDNQFATAHVELDSKLDLVESHELAENVMSTLREKLNVQATIHADPKAVSNPREAEYRRDLESAIYRSKIPLSYHDFFVRESEDHIHLYFELALSGYCKLNDSEIYNTISQEMKKINGKYTVEMMVDRNFISGKVYGSDKSLQTDIQKCRNEKKY